MEGQNLWRRGRDLEDGVEPEKWEGPGRGAEPMEEGEGLGGGAEPAYSPCSSTPRTASPISSACLLSVENFNHRISLIEK